MVKRYIEKRRSSARGTDSIVADVMRHMHTRQHLGKVVVVCDQPVAILSAARKQWLKLARAIQKQRASTLNADKILKYTHTITHMQHMHFTTKPPRANPEADVYFLTPGQLAVMPVHCLSVYVLCHIPLREGRTMLEQLAAEALLIDYDHSVPWREHLGLEPKAILEEQVGNEWQQVQRFVHAYGIDVTRLMVNDLHDVDAMDDALDTLLNVSYKFLEVANGFQHALELARPLRLRKETRNAYDSLVLLAYRVQALSPTAFTQHFLETYNEDDTFFLYDIAHGIRPTDAPAATYARHLAAGRPTLARAMLAHAAQATVWPRSATNRQSLAQIRRRSLP